MLRSPDVYEALISRRRAEILAIFKRYYPGQDTLRIVAAMDYAQALHAPQKRKSGEPYILHPLAVTKLVANAQLDECCVISALLHDTIEDTDATEENIRKLFDQNVADTVLALTKIRSVSSEKRDSDKQLTYARILKASAKDIRPLLIKIFDRLHNMREMGSVSQEHKRRVSRETIDVYAPFARRLGMALVERELTRLSLSHLFPNEVREIETRVDNESRNSESELYETIGLIEKLCADQNIKVEMVPVWPSTPDFYTPEIGLNLQQDIPARFYLLIEETLQIYTTLGILHSLFTPVPQAMRDMIASPMANGYRAMETKVVRHGRLYQFKLATREMFETNQQGIIANWRVNQNRLSGYYTSYMHLLEELLADDEIRLDDVLKQSHVDGIAIFSPKKDLYILPVGSTALDFAYEIHREVGNHAKAAVVNGIERPISVKLGTGQIVEILTDPAVHPEESWRTIAKSSKARSAINSWLTKQFEERLVEVGRDLLSSEFSKYGLDLESVAQSEEFKQILKLRKTTARELFRDVGYRQILPTDFIEAHNIVPENRIRKQRNAERQGFRELLFSKLRSDAGPGANPIWKISRDDLFIKYAQCCNPIFGDKVVGVLSTGKGVTVHRDTCSNLKAIAAGDKIEVEWDAPEQVQTAVLNLRVSDQKGVLSKVLGVVNRYHINLSEFNAYTVGREAFLKIRLDITRQSELLKLVKDIRKIDAVESISREE